MRVGDFVIATGASYSGGGTMNTYSPGECMAAVPDYDVLKALVESASRMGLTFHLGPVISSDNFYSGLDYLNRWIARGMIAVDMEAATLFLVGRHRWIKTGASFVISDVIGHAYEKMATAEELREAVDKASRAVFEAVISVKI